MVRVRYLLLTMLLWAFILAWWAGLVGWVAAIRAWPMGSLPSIVWPGCMLALAMPPFMAYLSWEYLWDQEKQRRSRPQNPQIRRETLRRAKENKRNLDSEDAQRRRTPASGPRIPMPATPPMPTTATGAAPRTASAILRGSRSTRSPSIEGASGFLDDFEEALRQLMDLDQKSSSEGAL
jgi:hypothetical protein